MTITTAPTSILVDLGRAIDRMSGAERTLWQERAEVRRLMMAAADAGITKTTLMDISGRTRVTVLRWIAEAREAAR